MPSAAAAVLLSRALSSWASEGRDAAATIYEGVKANRAGPWLAY